MIGIVAELRACKVTSYIAIDGNLTKTSKRRQAAINRRPLRHLGCEVSQRCRKRIEEVFGWIKNSAGLAKVKRADALKSMSPSPWPWRPTT